jgi:hypothetical protein
MRHLYEKKKYRLLQTPWQRRVVGEGYLYVNELNTLFKNKTERNAGHFFILEHNGLMKNLLYTFANKKKNYTKNMILKRSKMYQ